MKSRFESARKWLILGTLFIGIGAVGGAPVMLLTMLVIRHKTRHAKFMLTLPLFTLLHLAAICALWRI